MRGCGGRQGCWWLCLSSPRCGGGGCRGGSPGAAVPRAPAAAPLCTGVPGWGWRPPRRAHPGAQGRWVTSRALSQHSKPGGWSQGEDLGLGWRGSASGGGMSVNPASTPVGIRCYHPNPKWDLFGEPGGCLDALGGKQGKSEQHSKQWLGGCLENRETAQSTRGSSQRELMVPEVRGWHGSLQCTKSPGKHSPSPRAGSMGPSLQTLL